MSCDITRFEFAFMLVAFIVTVFMSFMVGYLIGSMKKEK